MPSAATVYQTLNLIAITCTALGGSTAARRRGLEPLRNPLLRLHQRPERRPAP
jgi:hypothetical protein